MCAPDDVSGSFGLNDCMCNGTEEMLLDCNTTMDVADCIASEAVMVNCIGKYLDYVYIYSCW